MNKSIGLVYSNFESADQAKEIAKSLIERGIAKCANIMAPHTAIYEWKNTIEKTNEVAVLFKCDPYKKEQLIKALKEIHPYDVPCILDIDASAIPEYAKWLAG